MHLYLGDFCCCLVLSGQEICPYGSKWLQILFLQVPHFLPYKGGNPPLVIVGEAGGHTSRWVLWVTSNFYAGRFFSHALERNYFKAIKAYFSGRGSLEHAGDIPSIFLVVFILFSLKSIDRHKNPGNATKEKTNVQRRSKNPELRRRWHWTAGCSRGGGRGSLHGAAGHGKHRKVRPPGRARWLC